MSKAKEDRVNHWLVLIMVLILPFVAAFALMALPVYWAMKLLGKE